MFKGDVKRKRNRKRNRRNHHEVGLVDWWIDLWSRGPDASEANDVTVERVERVDRVGVFQDCYYSARELPIFGHVLDVHLGL